MCYKLPNVRQPMQIFFRFGEGQFPLTNGMGPWPDCPIGLASTADSTGYHPCTCLQCKTCEWISTKFRAEARVIQVTEVNWSLPKIWHWANNNRYPAFVRHVSKAVFFRRVNCRTPVCAIVTKMSHSVVQLMVNFTYKSHLFLCLRVQVWSAEGFFRRCQYRNTVKATL